MTVKEAHTKVKEAISQLRKARFSVWYINGKYFLREYVLNGRKKEYYGHTFRIDFNGQTLTPVNGELK